MLQMGPQCRNAASCKTFFCRLYIFRGTYWLQQWAQLQQDEANKQRIIQIHPMLEAMAIFISYFWMTL
jgi:hypothetical protein